MSNLQQSDLILAGRYVDGDLPAHEVAAAESRIAADADFATAVEQIRQQSSLMNGLPKFSPTDDLADRTLQASMDQVKAIMGVWPIENADSKLTPASTHPSSDGVDWKSTAALVASLAGLFLFGTLLWQNWNGSTTSDMAMNEAPAAPVSAKVGSDVDMSDENTEQSISSLPVQQSNDAAPDNEEAVPPAAIASRIQVPEIPAFSGTPMKVPAKKLAANANAVTNTSAPVEQIWCVSQDRSASKNSVCDILRLNQIEVQLEQQRDTLPATPDAVEAFYVAATPGQIKLAMSQISNNADIEMIQLPGGTNSPIADAIQQQFAQSKPSFAAKDAQQQVDPSWPEHLQQPATNALAQQLFSNALPRRMPMSIPTGPVPPILKSGTPIEGLGKANASDLAMNSRAKAAAAVPAPTAMGGMGGAGFGGGADQAAADMVQAESQQQAIATPQQSTEYDKYLDDSDQQLRQYLILVRGGEAEK